MHLFALAGVRLMTVTANHCRLNMAGGDCGLALLENWDRISSPDQGMMLHIHKPVEERCYVMQNFSFDMSPFVIHILAL